MDVAIGCKDGCCRHSSTRDFAVTCRNSNNFSQSIMCFAALLRSECTKIKWVVERNVAITYKHKSLQRLQVKKCCGVEQRYWTKKLKLALHTRFQAIYDNVQCYQRRLHNTATKIIFYKFNVVTFCYPRNSTPTI